MAPPGLFLIKKKMPFSHPKGQVSYKKNFKLRGSKRSRYLGRMKSLRNCHLPLNRASSQEAQTGPEETREQGEERKILIGNAHVSDKLNRYFQHKKSNSVLVHVSHRPNMASTIASQLCVLGKILPSKVSCLRWANFSQKRLPWATETRW